ncbi:class I SAM-dependent methyltransferase [Coralliovum pocilloporae]|uniref:class I SAM-dependent methyltransferase n=1 Tax=Coralliovum pocilloporae TaxID=3066369 RepID=UPI003D9C6019
MPVPLTPDIRLWLANEETRLWSLGEQELDALGLPDPFWAFAWAGGQALARYVLDHPHLVQGRTVLDLASGSGLVAIAAAKSGAVHVTANDIDSFAADAIRLNTETNGADCDISTDNLIGTALARFDVILAGDIFYDQTMTDSLVPWLSEHAHRGMSIYVGDPERSYCPYQWLRKEASYEVAVTRSLEDHAIRKTSVWSWQMKSE